jgi:hypothetical protein
MATSWTASSGDRAEGSRRGDFGARSPAQGLSLIAGSRSIAKR